MKFRLIKTRKWWEDKNSLPEFGTYSWEAGMLPEEIEDYVFDEIEDIHRNWTSSNAEFWRFGYKTIDGRVLVYEVMESTKSRWIHHELRLFDVS